MVSVPRIGAGDERRGHVAGVGRCGFRGLRGRCGTGDRSFDLVGKWKDADFVWLLDRLLDAKHAAALLAPGPLADGRRVELVPGTARAALMKHEATSHDVIVRDRPIRAGPAPVRAAGPAYGNCFSSDGFLASHSRQASTSKPKFLPVMAISAS